MEKVLVVVALIFLRRVAAASHVSVACASHLELDQARHRQPLDFKHVV